MKKCSKCKEEKLDSLFYKDAYSQDGRHHCCADCKRKRNTEYRLADKEKYKDIMRNWYLKNKEEFTTNNKNKDNGLYIKYIAMTNRCSEKNPQRKYYYDKGICCEWISYEDFKKDMFESFLKHISENGKRQTTLDRIDSNKNYTKENCRWATYKQQAEYYRKVKLLKI